MERFVRRAVGAVVAGLLLTGAAHAGFTSFETFDALNAGQPLHGQNGWTSANAQTTTTVVAVKPGNNVGNAANTTNSGTSANYKGLGSLSIADGTTGTLFYTYVKSTGGVAGKTALNANVGATDVDAPANLAGDMALQLNSDPASSGGQFRARSNNAFKLLSTDGAATGNFIPNADTAYNVWMVVDNAANNYKVYIQSSDDARVATQTQLLAADGSGGTFGFRDTSITRGTNLAIDTFNFGIGGGGTTAILQVDNVYLDTAGANLSNPVPEPSALGALGLVSLGLFARRRNRSR